MSAGASARRRSSRSAQARSADEADITAFCRERIAHYKCPDAVVFGELPKTSTGKVQKSRLREPEWAGHERGIN